MSNAKKIFFVFTLLGLFAISGCANQSLMRIETATGVAVMHEDGTQEVYKWNAEAKEIARQGFPGRAFCRSAHGGSAVYDRFERACYGPNGARLSESHAGTHRTGWGLAMTPLIQGAAVVGASAIKADAYEDAADARADAQVKAAQAIGAGLGAQDHSTRVSNGSSSTSEGGTATTTQSQGQDQGQTARGGSAVSNSNAQTHTNVGVESNGGSGYGGQGGTGGRGGNAQAGSSAQNNTGVNVQQAPESGYWE